MDGNNSLNIEIKKLIKEKKYEEAERILKVTIYKDKNSTIFNLLGLLYYRKGSYKKSQEYFIESYKYDSNKEAHYYLDTLFENNDVFNKYYSVFNLCRNKNYKEAECLIDKLTNIKQSSIINLTIQYMKGSIFRRKKILKKMKKLLKEDKRAERIYKSMRLNYRSRIRRIVLYFLFIAVLFLGTSLILL